MEPNVYTSTGGKSDYIDYPLLGVVHPKQHVRSQILSEANDLINGDREDDYGAPSDNFARIASIWNVLFPGSNFTPEKVALAMIGLKLARSPEGYKRDTAVDLAGYAALYAELSEEAADE